MTDPLTAAAVIFIGAGTGYSAYESSRQTQAVKKQAIDQEAAQKKLSEDEEKKRLQSLMAGQKRRGAVGEPGTRDTILTGQLGAVGTPQTGGKTLLGQ